MPKCKYVQYRLFVEWLFWLWLLCKKEKIHHFPLFMLNISLSQQLGYHIKVLRHDWTIATPCCLFHFCCHRHQHTQSKVFNIPPAELSVCVCARVLACAGVMKCFQTLQLTGDPTPGQKVAADHMAWSCSPSAVEGFMNLLKIFVCMFVKHEGNTTAAGAASQTLSVELEA